MARFSTAQFLRGALLTIGSLLLMPGGIQAQTLPASEGLVADATELRVLRQFYDATNGAQWSTQTNWLTGTTLADAATWFGVDVAQGDVVGLALPANNLSGALPAALGELRGLQTLELWRNALGGAPLPAELGQLTNLRVLSLQQSGISGGLPVELGQLTRLQELELSNNQLSGSIPAQLGQLAALRHLNLAGNGLTGALPAALGQLTELRYLDVAANALTGPLPAALGNLAQLERLELWQNDWQDTIPAAWGRLRQLQELNAQRSGLRGPVPDALGQLAALRKLNLSTNQLAGPLPAAWGRLRELRQLHLNNNRFSGALPDSLARLRQLSYLGLEHNQFRGPLTPLAALVGLDQLDAADNGFTGSLEPLRPLVALEYVSLGTNRLSGPLDALAALPRLRRLDLRGNALTGTLPAGLLQGALLQALYLGGNQLTDVAPLAGVNPAFGFDFTNNTLDFAALERLYQGPNQPRLGYLEAGGQRPTARLDTVPYQAGGLLLLSPPARGEQHGYRYQWQRLVGGQWLDMPGDTLATRRWTKATAAEQGTYRRAGRNRWFTNPALAPTVLYSAMLYADLVPYQPLARNRPDDANTGLALATLRPAPDATAASPADVNYVRTWTPRVALTTLGATPTPAEPQALVTTQYLDGLGRPLQTVQHRASPQGRDLVQPMAYDALGRSPKQFLPYADTAENARTTVQGYHYRALAHQQEFYARTTVPGGGAGPLAPGDATLGVARTGRAYAETAFEASPLNRVLAQGAAGEAGQLTAGHIVERNERPNTAADSVLRFQPGDDSSSPDPGFAGFYAPGELWGTEVADAHGPTEPGAHGYRTLEWKDKEGRLVLRQVEASRARTTAGRGSGPGPVSALYARWLRTAYAYDDFGRLRFVLQPEGTRRLLPLPAGTALPAGVAPFLFRYRYDERGRQIAKQVPGQDGETVVVYDQLDRPVMSQDPVQRGRHEWNVTKYDALGRVVLTGLLYRPATDTLSRAGLQALAAADTAAAQQYEVRTANGTYADFYTYDRAFPRPSQQGFLNGVVMSLTYYDDYDFNNDGAADVTYNPATDSHFPTGAAPVADEWRTTGLVTRTKTRVLGVAENDPTQAAWLTTTTFYDERARPVQVQTTNARKGTDLLTTQLDFQGKVVQSVALHTGPNHAPLTVAEFFTYDPAGRLLTTAQQLPGEAQPSQIATVQYNELGQATRKTMGTGRLAQAVKYAYNIRGWLTSLNNPYYPVAGDLFNLSLHYETGFTAGYEQYNGNLTGQTWRGRDGVQRAYGYAYDPLNRLLQGDFVARNAAAAATPAIPGLWTAEADNYRLSFASYDDNGNLKTLRRRGLLANASHTTAKQYGPVDNLNYAYAGNRMQAVDDLVSTNQLPRPAGYAGAPTSLAGDFQEQGVHQATEYDYDPNGNLTQDRNKGLSGIAYNHLNLPKQIRFGTGADSIVFHYSATGQKVAKLVYQTGKPTRRTDYLGPYQYEQDSLRFFPHAEGRVLRFVSKDAAGQPTARYQREFSFKDHLGNLRLAYRAGQVRTLTATLEPDAPTHARESQQFDSLSVSPPVAVPTGLARTGQYAARLNAGGPAPQPLGPLTQLPVQKGDTLFVTAPGRYQQATSNHTFSLLSFIASLLQPAPAGTPPGADGSRRGGLPLLQVGLSSATLLALNQLPGGVPKAYLRVLSFNQDSVLVDQRTIQLTAAALGNYETLSTGQLIVQHNGYVSVYVGNESATDVYFDDVTIEHRQGLQIQENHYDPFGLDLAGVNNASLGIKPLNQRKFNGKEFQPDLGLNWSDYGARMYDAQLALWHSVDPLSMKYYTVSPYNYCLNNPVNYIDPDGRDVFIRYKGQDIKYDNGTLYNNNGTAYTGKTKGFLKTTVNALNEISNKSSTGSKLLTELQASSNSFTIQKTSGKNEFNETNTRASVAKASSVLSPGSNPPPGGSGGVVSWNPSAGSVWEVGGSQAVKPVTNLAHELLGHGVDSNRGEMDNTPVNGLKRDEWQASFVENKIRSEMGMPYREYYRTQDNAGTLTPLPPNLLQNGLPILPPSILPSGYSR